MKTASQIKIGTALASSLFSQMSVIGYMNSEQEEQNATYLMVSETCDAIRQLFEALPANLKNEEGEELESNLFPHKFENDDQSTNWGSFESLVNRNHTFWYDLWQQMQDAKDKFGL